MRFINWSKIIKPNLVIIYQAKNELTPFYQGNQKEKYINNDYQNILGQYSSIFDLKKFKFFFYIPIVNMLIYYLFIKKK